MKAKPHHNDYLNSLLDNQLRIVQPLTQISPAKRTKHSTSPNRLKSSDSLSLSITQKDSNIKHLPDIQNYPRSSSTKNPQATSIYNPNLLSEQLVLLQSKLSNLEEKFLSMNTPEKQKPKRSRGGQFKKSQNNAVTKSFIENKNTVKRREGVNGKIQPTTRFSLGDKKNLNLDARCNRQTVVSREMLDQRSIDSIRSVQRSKDKEIHQLKLQVSKCKNSMESSRVKKQKVEKQVDLLKQKINQYKILEQRQRQMINQNQKLARALQKSESIRQKQKQMLHEYKIQIKQLKEALNKKKF